MVAKRKAEVTWEGDLLRGNGRIRFETSSMPEAPVTWASRIGQQDGKTSPEELLAAAHASCYAMALSATLARNRTPPIRLEVEAECTLDEVEGKWLVTKMEITTRGNVPGIDDLKFVEMAETAAAACPISNAIRNNVEIKLHASLLK